jgi:AmmeMemoRadiSam system protein A
MLTHLERIELLAIARDAIAQAVRGETPAPPRAPQGSLAGAGGAFVTLRRHGELRGCIGYIESPLPLAQVVQEVAVKAAREDPRFPSVRPEELSDLTCEVSVLSPIQQVNDVTEILVGRDGVLLELGGNRGVLLPQVAVEYRWSREEFLANTARKAGLPPRAWEDHRAKLYRFSAEVVGEAHGGG